MHTASQRPLLPPGAALQPGTVTLEGVLELVSCANAETGWSVVKLTVVGRSDLVTAVGSLTGVQPGESLRLTGRWVVDRKWGEQFRIESFATVKPATLEGIEKYLSSGRVRGIGRVMAERLVQCFGLATLDVIEKSRSRSAYRRSKASAACGRSPSSLADPVDPQAVLVTLDQRGLDGAVQRPS